MGVALFDHQLLMASAADPTDIATLAFGGVLARSPIHGLSSAALHQLLMRYFPGLAADAELPVLIDTAGCAPLCADEMDDLVTLLLTHRTVDTEESRWLAYTIATACLHNNHLWQDLGLPHRDGLSELLRTYFTTLYYKNSGNMKWKKFFYKQLCEQAEVMLCKAPSCKVCSDYAQCFGPEDA